MIICTSDECNHVENHVCKSVRLIMRSDGLMIEDDDDDDEYDDCACD